MPLSKRLFVIVLTLILSDAVYADKTQLNYDASVLPKGAKIVAGDPGKNDFFIVADNTEPQAKPVTKEVVNQAVNEPAPQQKPIIPEIKMAWEQAAESSVNKHPGPVVKTTAVNHQKVKNVAVSSKKTMAHQPILKTASVTRMVHAHHLSSHASLKRKTLKTAHSKYIPKIKSYSALLHKPTHKKIHQSIGVAINKSARKWASKKHPQHKSVVLKGARNTVGKVL